MSFRLIIRRSVHAAIWKSCFHFRLFIRQFMAGPLPQFLEVENSAAIAYHKLLGSSEPGVVFLPGFMSDMMGKKAFALEKLCKDMGHSYIRFDYRGIGESHSSPGDMTIGNWKKDVLAILDKLTTGPQILVGSSMGAWIMLLVAMERPKRLHSLVGIATAADFTVAYVDKIAPMSREQEIRIGSFMVSKNFIMEGLNHCILDKPSIPITCPVKLIHGMRDSVVPPDISVKVAEKLESQKVDIIFRKEGEHRMSESEDIDLIIAQVKKLLQK